MGWSLSWVAVSSRPRDVLMKELGFEDTGEAAQPGTSEFVGGQLPNGWYVVVLNGFGHQIVEPASLKSLSREASVVACSESEQTNTSFALSYQDGEPVWELMHQLGEGGNELEVEGSPPEALKEIREAASEAHAREGYDAAFSIPGRVAGSVCGYGFGGESGQDVRFTRLKLSESPPAPFLEFESLWRSYEQRAKAREWLEQWGDASKIREAIVKRLQDVLVPLGFETQSNSVTLVRNCGAVSQTVGPVVQDYLVNIGFRMRHAKIQSIVKTWGKVAGLDDFSYAFYLPGLEYRRANFLVGSPAALDALLALLEARAPYWVERMKQLEDLDALNRQTRDCEWFTASLLKRRCSFVVGAYLASTELDSLVTALGSPETTLGRLNDLVSYLKANVQLGEENF